MTIRADESPSSSSPQGAPGLAGKNGTDGQKVMLLGLRPGPGMRVVHSGISVSQILPWGRASRPGPLATARSLWLQHPQFLPVQGMQDKRGHHRA